MPSPSAAVIGQGTQLQRNSVTISEIQTINGPSEQTAITEVTNHDSAGSVREWINGLIDPGSLAFDANLLVHDSTQDGVTGFYYAYHARIRETYTVLPAIAGLNGSYTMQGLPIKHDKKFPSDGKQQMFSGEIKITGVVAFAP